MTKPWREPAAGRMAVEQFAALGRWRIGYVGSTLRYPYQQAMLKGFWAALRTHKLEENAALIQAGQDADGATRKVRLSRLLQARGVPNLHWGVDN